MRKKALIIIIVIVFLVILFILYARFSSQLKSQGKTLDVFSGTGMSEPMSEIAEMYEKEKGVSVNITFKSAGQSLNTMELTTTGDVFFPGTTKWFDICIEKNIVKESDIYHMATRTPVIMVQKGNPKNIHSIDDLYRGDSNDVMFCLHDKQTTLGKLAAEKIFTEEQMSLLEDNIVSTEGSLAQVYNKIALKVADSGFGWLSYVESKDDVEAVMIPEVIKHSEKLSIAPTIYAKDYSTALDFVQYVSGNKGKAIFEKYGFEVTE